MTQQAISLIKAAVKTMKNSPNIEEQVVAGAVLGRNGKIYTGFNLFRRHYAGSICGEMAAISAGISDCAPDKFDPVLIVGVKPHTKAKNGVAVINQCGSCLQRLKDSYPDTKILVADMEGRVEEKTLEYLLPHGYDKARGDY